MKDFFKLTFWPSFFFLLKAEKLVSVHLFLIHILAGWIPKKKRGVAVSWIPFSKSIDLSRVSRRSLFVFDEFRVGRKKLARRIHHAGIVRIQPLSLKLGRAGSAVAARVFSAA